MISKDSAFVHGVSMLHKGAPYKKQAKNMFQVAEGYACWEYFVGNISEKKKKNLLKKKKNQGKHCFQLYFFEENENHCRITFKTTGNLCPFIYSPAPRKEKWEKKEYR